MKLTLVDLIVFWLFSVLVISLLFSWEEVGAEDEGRTTSQKDLAMTPRASFSGSKIVDASFGASMDINSTQ